MPLNHSVTIVQGLVVGDGQPSGIDDGIAIILTLTQTHKYKEIWIGE